VSTCREVRNNIKNLNAYIANFPAGQQQSAAVEMLFAKAMKFMFHLPYFTSTTDNAAISKKVIWYGRHGTNLVQAPPGADAIVFARHFDVLVEVTQTTGTVQWNREFARAVRHMEDYITNNQKERDEVYLVLIVQEIHRDTYESIRQKIREGLNMVLLTFKNVEKILEVSPNSKIVMITAVTGQTTIKEAIIKGAIDFFKKVNDTYGHLMGDQVLRDFAQYLKQSIRSLDMFYRFGGEEFVIVFPKTTSEEAKGRLNELIKGFSKKIFNHNGIECISGYTKDDFNDRVQ